MESNTVVEKTVTINAKPAKVWEVLTNPERITQWLSDIQIEVISDWKVGSLILFSGKENPHKFQDKGTILELETDRVFKYSYWTPISRQADIPENYATIEFRLSPRGDQTVVNLKHSNITAEAAYEHVNYYWGVTLVVIKKLVEGKI